MKEYLVHISDRSNLSSWANPSKGSRGLRVSANSLEEAAKLTAIQLQNENGVRKNVYAKVYDTYKKPDGKFSARPYEILRDGKWLIDIETGKLIENKKGPEGPE